jgi:dUTP pyrophosphatase
LHFHHICKQSSQVIILLLMNLFVQKIDHEAHLPVYGTVHSAGLDLFALEDTHLPGRSTTAVRTGVAFMWDDPTYYLQIHSRSSLASQDITVEAGVIDYDYCREIFVLLHNHNEETKQVLKHHKIGQGIFVQKATIQSFRECTSLLEKGKMYFPYSTSVERNGGFGSTGK